MEIRFLTTSAQQARGAMAFPPRPLGDVVLVFLYPSAAKRRFHTFFCKPLRILAFDRRGRILFDRVVPPNRFVSLPATHFIVECDPGAPVNLDELSVLAVSPPSSGSLPGSWRADASLDTLMVSMLTDAVADLKQAKVPSRRTGI